MIFNSYMKFEEQMLKSEINESDEYEIDQNLDDEMDKLVNETFDNMRLNEVKEKTVGKKETKKSKKHMAKENADHADDHNAAADVIKQIKLFRLESLLERRPFLLSDAHLRQNSNNVKEFKSELTFAVIK